MKIVILDAYAVNSGDISWNPVSSLGEVTVYDRTTPELVVERCAEAEIILTNKAPINRVSLQKLSSLRLISVMATGYNVIDIEAAREKNIVVSNVPAYGTSSVAQHAVALLLELTNRVGLHAASVATGEWFKDWSYAKTPIIELDGKTMGIVGFGSIGQQTAKIAKAMGMTILYSGPNKKQTDLGTYVTIEKLFAESDAISLHCPQKPENTGFVNRKLIELMKPTAFFINASRGQLVNEEDLADALNSGRIAGAGLDVLSTEPPSADNPLLNAKNCIITPHNAWMSREARQRIIEISGANVSSFLEGKPIHVVN